MAFTDSVTLTTTWPGTTIEVPANGDAYNNANAKAMFQKFANGLQYLRSSTLKMNLTEAPYWAYLWTQSATMEQAESWVTGSASGNELLKVRIPTPPAGLTMATLTIRLKGAGGHSWPIGAITYAAVYRKSITAMDGSWSAVSSASDPSGSAAAYQVEHSLVISPAHAMSQDYHYELRVAGEGGANALAGLIYYGGQIVYTY